MPYSENKTYTPPLFLFNRHLETIYPALFRNVEIDNPYRERLELSDGDFLDLDWFKYGHKRLAIVNHGLEGNSSRPYMLGMAKAFKNNSWDTLCWNFRSCSGEMNRLPRFYHSGETNDIQSVVDRAIQDYEEIVFVGFSLGGNMMLKYLGERGKDLNSKIKACITFSVPVDLETSCYQIMKTSNRVYERRFLNNLKNKVLIKDSMFPGLVDFEKVMKVKNILEFDDLVTAPLHGFKNALDYYEKSSALQYLEHISVPTLLNNAKNDPMLSKKCYPDEIAKNHNDFHFEKWTSGGHVGFYEKGDFYRSEKRVFQFLNELGY